MNWHLPLLPCPLIVTWNMVRNVRPQEQLTLHPHTLTISSLKTALTYQVVIPLSNSVPQNIVSVVKTDACVLKRLACSSKCDQTLATAISPTSRCQTSWCHQSTRDNHSLGRGNRHCHFKIPVPGQKPGEGS